MILSADPVHFPLHAASIGRGATYARLSLAASATPQGVVSLRLTGAHMDKPARSLSDRLRVLEDEDPSCTHLHAIARQVRRAEAKLERGKLLDPTTLPRTLAA